MSDSIGLTRTQFESNSDITSISVGKTTDSVLANGIEILYAALALLSAAADAKYSKMQEQMNVARDAQKLANDVQATINSIKDADGRGEVNQAAIDYLTKNNIMITDSSGTQWTAVDWVNSKKDQDGKMARADLARIFHEKPDRGSDA